MTLPSQRTLRARTLLQRITFVAAVTLIVALVLGIGIPLALGAGFMSSLMTSGCGGETTPTMAYEDVSFPSVEFGKPTPAYFIPGSPPGDPANGATVIVVPTGNAGRGDRMDEIAIYHAAGFNVLSYSARTCVGGAAATLGYREAMQVGDALAYLATRSDVDMSRIGIHGFSAGGAAAIIKKAVAWTLRSNAIGFIAAIKCFGTSPSLFHATEMKVG